MYVNVNMNLILKTNVRVQKSKQFNSTANAKLYAVRMNTNFDKRKI